MSKRIRHPEGSPSPGRDQNPAFLRSSDLKAIQRHGRDLRPPMTAADLLKYHLHQSLLGRIEAGRYSPRRLALEVGQHERGDKEVGPTRKREKCVLKMENWDRVERAGGRANTDLLLWIDEIAEKGTALPSPICRCTAEAIVRAAGREIVERAQVFSQGAGPLASDIRPGPCP